MPFASIYPIHPRTNPGHFREEILQIGGFENLSFFKKQTIFLLQPHENQSTFIEQQGWVKILMITWFPAVFDPGFGFHTLDQGLLKF